MDASALLKSQGWRGTGFSLHPTDNAIGLARPLLISRNTDGRGVGQKPHHTSDQWWLHAFDQKLKGLDTSKKGAVTQAVTQGKLDVVSAGKPGGKYTGSAGLYASFVRGETMVGSVTLPKEETATEGSEEGETKAERKARREVRRAVKEREAKVKERERARRRKEVDKARRKAAKKAEKRAARADETKDERKARRAERRARKEARRKRREAKGRA